MLWGRTKTGAGKQGRSGSKPGPSTSCRLAAALSRGSRSSHDTGYETISSMNCPVFPSITTTSLWSAGGST